MAKKKKKISPRDKNWDKYIELTIILQSQDGGNSWGIKELIHDWNWRKPPGFVEALFFPMKTSKPHFKKDWKKGLDELADRHKRYRNENRRKK